MSAGRVGRLPCRGAAAGGEAEQRSRDMGHMDMDMDMDMDMVLSTLSSRGAGQLDKRRYHQPIYENAEPIIFTTVPRARRSAIASAGRRAPNDRLRTRMGSELSYPCIA